MKIIYSILLLLYSSTAWSSSIGVSREDIVLQKELIYLEQKERLEPRDVVKIKTALTARSPYAQLWAQRIILTHRLKDVWDEFKQANPNAPKASDLSSHYSTPDYSLILENLFSGSDFREIYLLDIFPEDRIQELLSNNDKTIPEKEINDYRFIHVYPWAFDLDMIVVDLCRHDSSPNNDYARSRLQGYELIERQRRILNNEPGAIAWFATEDYEDIKIANQQKTPLRIPWIFIAMLITMTLLVICIQMFTRNRPSNI